VFYHTLADSKEFSSTLTSTFKTFVIYPLEISQNPKIGSLAASLQTNVLQTAASWFLNSKCNGVELTAIRPLAAVPSVNEFLKTVSLHLFSRTGSSQ